MVGRAKHLWVNDRLVPVEKAALDPRDRGFTLGDGLFETIRVRGGRALLLDLHLARLRTGAGRIGLSRVPDGETLSGAIRMTLEANGLSDAAVRLTVSRGVPANRGLSSKPEPTPSLVVHAQPFAGYPAELYSRGMRAAISSIPRNERSPLARIKALSYLDNVLARREADARGVDEALMLNTAGHLACASAANLFLARRETLLTPDPESGVLPGTIRGLVLAELAPRMGLTAVERPVRTEELAKADEAFLTSALLGVMPLTEVDGLPVGTGGPGPISSGLRAELEEIL
ncbi:branched chain amino acid--2-keto-4-methylthiobutyrate aminotransferase [soil metagenome]